MGNMDSVDFVDNHKGVPGTSLKPLFDNIILSQGPSTVIFLNHFAQMT